jgi:LPXTG-site transpeptidase (sortase) family protein
MKIRYLYVVLIVSGVVLLGAGIWLLTPDSVPSSGDVAAAEATLRPPAIIPASPDVPGDVPTPTTSPPTREATPSADIAEPVVLRIERLNVDAPIAPYGVNRQTGEMEVPDNATEVGWYKFGPRPGEPGSAVLAAHVDLASSGPGVFFELDSLEEGDRLSVLYADGTESAFRVIARTTYEKDKLPLDVIFSREGPSVLTLITCGGDFNRNVSRYDSNVVVYAVPDMGDEPRGGSTL